MHANAVVVAQKPVEALVHSPLPVMSLSVTNHRDSFGVLEQPQEICQPLPLPLPHTMIFLQNFVDEIQFSVVSTTKS